MPIWARMDGTVLTFCVLLIFSVGYGQREYELRSDTFSANAINVLLVSIDDFFYNGKAKSGAFLVFSSGEVCLIEALPDFLDGFRGDSNSVVLYGNKAFVISQPGLNLDGRIGMAEFNGIIDKIVKHLLYF